MDFLLQKVLCTQEASVFFVVNGSRDMYFFFFLLKQESRLAEGRTLLLHGEQWTHVYASLLPPRVPAVGACFQKIQNDWKESEMHIPAAAGT
jgi:hypothetical protein